MTYVQYSPSPTMTGSLETMHRKSCPLLVVSSNTPYKKREGQVIDSIDYTYTKRNLGIVTNKTRVTFQVITVKLHQAREGAER